MEAVNAYWYDKNASLIDAILDAVASFIERRGYKPSLIILRKDVYETARLARLRKSVMARFDKSIPVGYSKHVTSSHFHLYPVVTIRHPVLLVERRPVYA